MSLARTLNAALLVAGTSVGAGMLGLPVVTGDAGFFPSAFFLVLIWLVMTSTALLFAEVLDKAEKEANFVSLSEKLLGNSFKVASFCLYVLLFLSLSFAYAKGGGIFISGLSEKIPVTLGVALFLAAFVPLIMLGASFLGSVNSLLVFCLFFAFFTLIFLGVHLINPELLLTLNWRNSLHTIPLFITSFGFHSILPSLKTYVQDKRTLQKAIVIGTTTTLFIYLAWEFFVLGIVPAGELAQALAADHTAITPLGKLLDSPLLQISAHLFYFSALATSFLGVGYGLIDFFEDAFSMKQNLLSRTFLCIVIYVPAFWASQTDLRIFYLSLEYGGGPACFYLLILLPILLYGAMKVKERRAMK